MDTFFILGSDKRYIALGDILKDEGKVFFRAPIKGEKGMVIFPMLLKSEENIGILKSLEKGTEVLAGRFSDEEHRIIKKNSLIAHELLKDKRYLIANSEATAEGVFAEVIKNTGLILSEQCCLIIGYGNAGKAISDILYLNGAEVFIYSHSGSLARAERDGYNTISIKSRRIRMFDFIINTAEGEIFDESILSEMCRYTKVFQVASGECGDPAIFEKCGIELIRLPALPAKYSPLSDAMAISQFIKFTKR